MMTTQRLQNEKLDRRLVLLPLFLAAIVYLLSATGRAVTDYDEGYYAQVAQRMAEQGDWVTPYADGIRFLEKPPLMYWVTAASFKIFGVNEFALRLPTAIAVIALVWIVMLIARTLSSERAVLIAGLGTAFSAGTYLFTRDTLHDIWLVLFIALAMYAFLKWYLDPLRSLRPALLFYVAMAGAVMCKSLIGAAFPLGIAAAFFALSRKWPRWRTLHLFPGTLLFLGLTVPWHWCAAVQNQGFLKFFFVGEQFLRFFGKREPPVLWSVPLFTFWALILVWLFPWTAFLQSVFSECRRSEDGRQRALVKLAIAWAAVVVGFFSFSDRLEHYTFPALPAFSLLVAVALSKRGESKPILWAFRGLALIGVLAAVAGLAGGMWLASGHEFQFNTGGPTHRLAETDFSIIADMPPEIVAALIRPAAVTMVALAIGFLSALWFEAHGRRIQAVLSVTASMVVVCGMVHWSLNICEDLISSKKFGVAIAQEARPGDRLIVVGDYESANSLNFYEPLRVEIYGGTAYALLPGMKYPDAPQIIMTKQEFQKTWLSADRVFVLVPKDRLGELNPGGTEMIRVLHRVLLRND